MNDAVSAERESRRHGEKSNLVLFLPARDGLTHDQALAEVARRRRRAAERCQDAEAQLRELWPVCQRRECTMPSRPAIRA